MRPLRLVLAAFLSILLNLSALNTVVGAESAQSATPLIQHMSRILTGNGSQWRTANPDFVEGSEMPEEFGLRMRLDPARSHVTGELSGIFAGDQEVIYWSMLAFYNPVTEKMILQQIAADGTLLRGEVPVQSGKRQITDLTMFAADGTMQHTRHQMHFIDANTHDADAMSLGSGGQWQLDRRWRWHRVATPNFQPAKPDSSGSSAIANSRLAPYVRNLVAGSGQWRADNPDYTPGTDSPIEFGMNYRWGPHKQHIVAEIISIYDDERIEKDWSLYITHNPVLQTTTMEQTGGNGVYFRGELDLPEGNAQVENGLVFLPNGMIRSVRDRHIYIDERTRNAQVFERDAQGNWEIMREWVWRRL